MIYGRYGQKKKDKDQDQDEGGTAGICVGLIDTMASRDGFVPKEGDWSTLPD